MPSLIAPVETIDGKETDHWYEVLPDGTIVPRFDCDLRDARLNQKMGGIGFLPSCSKIIHDMLGMPELATYKEQSTVDGTLDALLTRLDTWAPIDRQPSESDTDFFKRAVAEFLPAKGTRAFQKVAVDAGKQKVVVAASHGTAVHAATEKYLAHGVMPAADSPVRPSFDRVMDWLTDNVRTVIFSERFVFSRLGYAGTSDLGLILKDGSMDVTDIKNSRWKKTSKTKPPRPYFKFGHPLQVVGYRGAAAECLDPEWATAGGRILHVNSAASMPVVDQPFTRKELDQYIEVYRGFVAGWQLKCKYRPNVERLPATFAIGRATLTSPAHAAAALAEVASDLPVCAPER